MFASNIYAQTTTNYEDSFTPPDVSKFVSNLTKKQQADIKVIAEEGKADIDSYRNELMNLREAIQHFYKMPGDRSSELFPLYAQRSALYAKIDKTKYYTKMKIDQVLTPEQQQELRTNLEHERKKREIKKQLTLFLHPAMHK